MPCGRRSTATHTGEKNEGVSQSAVDRGALYYPVAMRPGCRRTQRGTLEWLLYTGVCAILISGKFPNTVSQLLQEALSMEQQW